METSPTTRRPIAWTHNLTWAFIVGFSLLIVNSFHYYHNGIPFDWSGHLLGFGVTLALLTIRDWGQTWTIQPRYLLLGVLFAMCMWPSVISLIELCRQSGNIKTVGNELLEFAGLALLVAGLLFTYHHTLSFLFMSQHENRDSNAG